MPPGDVFWNPAAPTEPASTPAPSPHRSRAGPAEGDESEFDQADGPSVSFPVIESQASGSSNDRHAQTDGQCDDDWTSDRRLQLEREFNITEADLIDARKILLETPEDYSLVKVKKMMEKVIKVHKKDPNFPLSVVNRIEAFLQDESIMNFPENHDELIKEMRLQAALINSNSPYSEVRAVVDNRDDPGMPCSTVRAWVIGLFLSAVLALVNQLFNIRMPPVSVSSQVILLLAYPLGKAAERWLPRRGFTLLGSTHALNPGKFSKKEHMLIAIMANVAGKMPCTNYILWVQFLPQYFGQPYAASMTYQMLVALSTNLIGYSVAGACRRFLVHPVHCVWPSCLVTIALNSAFHDQLNRVVAGPGRTTWRASRLRAFLVLGGGMFVYSWVPSVFFAALSYFNWTTWIAPDNVPLVAVTGMVNGLGINPWPTFDWSVVISEEDPLMIPFFSTINRLVGGLVSAAIILALWYTNAYWTAYLPINTNRLFDHFGRIYDLRRAVDAEGQFNILEYRLYSPPFLSAANITTYMVFFAMYSATLTYAALYHRREIVHGVRNSFQGPFWQKRRKPGSGGSGGNGGNGNGIEMAGGDGSRGSNEAGRRNGSEESGRRSVGQDAAVGGGSVGVVDGAGSRNGNDDDGRRGMELVDAHARLMKKYEEAPDWWYLVCLVVAVVFAATALAMFEDFTPPAVVLYGLLLCVVFVIPIGLVKSMTGIEVGLNVLAEFIGGCLSDGNAVSMNYFKTYGYVTCAQAIWYSNDLKLAHYLKIPPRQTFCAQGVATLVSTFVGVAVLNFQMRSVEGVCTPEAKYRLTCPGVNTFFTASVLWGTVGPGKLWGADGTYRSTLLAFPFGALVVLLVWAAGKARPHWAWLRQIHPVVLLAGGLSWAPWNMSFLWPAVPFGWLSWGYLKMRYLPLWSKYNFIVSAAFTSGIALSGILIFFVIQIPELEFDWWGNSVTRRGCEGGMGCSLMNLQPGEYFGPEYGEF